MSDAKNTHPAAVARLRRHLAPWTPWVLAVGAALLAVLGFARWLVDVQLTDNGAEESEHWVEFVGRSVPTLPDDLRAGRFTPATLAQLKLLGHVDEVFRFRLYDSAGRPVLDDGQLGLSAPDLPDAQSTLARRAQVLAAGQPALNVHHRGQGRVQHFSVALVPLRDARGSYGLFEVYVDQTERAEALEGAFMALCVMVVVLTLSLSGVAAWRGWQRLRRELRTEERVRYLASHDALSGTLNRTSFLEALEATAWRHQGGGPAFAVLAIDLDRFKDVNDGHGHAAGDEVLRLVGERLRTLLRAGDAVARLGGDEFAVMQCGVQQPQDVARLAQRIVDLLGEPFPVGEAQMRLGGSVGAALYDASVADVATLLKHADTALYQAKADGRGCFRFYDPGIDSAMEQRRELARDLRLALEAGQLHLAFQALYDADGRTLHGYEALMRWNHPRLGAVSPTVFIPLAEEGGLIGEMGAWALREACREAAAWPASLCVAVNLSPAQFRHGDLLATVQQALADSRLAPSRLELEITESLLISNTQQVLAILNQLSALGVRVAMDDFGTGYSSLAYLWRFPFDRIKIDRAFVKDIADDARVDLIVKSIIELAHALRIRVTGEGVETREQLHALARHGCDEVQGFLLARPAPAATLQHQDGPARVEGPAPGEAPPGACGDASSQAHERTPGFPAVAASG